MPSSKRPRSPELGDGAPRGKRVSKARKAARRQRRRDNREQVEITVTFRHDYDWPFGDDDSTYKDREPSLFNDDPPANAQVMAPTRRLNSSAEKPDVSNAGTNEPGEWHVSTPDFTHTPPPYHS